MDAPTLNHVSVTCESIERSLAFYGDLLGLRVLRAGEVSGREHEVIIGLGAVRLRFAELDLGDGRFLELFEYLEPRGDAVRSRTCDPGNVHFAVAVSDIDEVYARLDRAGVTTRSAPIMVGSGEWRGARAFYSVDPDGVTVELIQFPGESGQA